MNPFERTASYVQAAMRQQTVPQPSLPRVTLIPGKPEHREGLEGSCEHMDYAPGVVRELKRETTLIYAATPDRVQIDMSKADAQLLQGLLANLTKRNRGFKLDNLSSALHQALPARHYGCVIIDGVQVSVSEVFPQLY